MSLLWYGPVAQRARDLDRAPLSAADLALIKAVKLSDEAAVRGAVLGGANIHAHDPDYGYLTPLTAAAWRGDRQMMAVLKELGANKPLPPSKCKAKSKTKSWAAAAAVTSPPPTAANVDANADAVGGDASTDGSGGSTSALSVRVHATQVGRSHRIYSYDADVPPSVIYA
mmetsp:Transcript_72521/g.206505  ORF Transcript_72521/g.206505 Transcript_72521/m.206505 type:complete len:170 (+) Transcript_72521:294-803(+)